jgi:hypothetical protein
MQMTLLDITQDILSDMSSDNVNSINDTEESLQVARIVRTTFFEIISGADWPHLKEMFQLTALGDANKPTHMRLPTSISKVETIRYNMSINGQVEWGDVKFVDAEYFLEYVSRYDSSSTSNQLVTDITGIQFAVSKSDMPSIWTSFDDDYIVFNGYNNTVDGTLQQSKTLCTGYREATFTLTDNAIPDMPAKMFSLLLAEAKSTCFNALKQQPNAKEEQRVRRQRSWLGTERHRTISTIEYPDYGR